MDWSSPSGVSAWESATVTGSWTSNATYTAFKRLVGGSESSPTSAADGTFIHVTFSYPI